MLMQILQINETKEILNIWQIWFLQSSINHKKGPLASAWQVHSYMF